jgi:PEP-CTERM motif
MKKLIKNSPAAKAAFAALMIGASFVKLHAGAVIVNPAGTVALGVNDLGHLNFSGTTTSLNAGTIGVSLFDAAGNRGSGFYDGTAPGCLCEGWGVSANETFAGYANEAVGTAGLTLSSFTSTATTATSVVTLTSLPALKVTQAYAPSVAAPGILFEDKVTITNTGLTDLTNVRYVRVMDWDIPPTEFSEYVTIKGVATTTLLSRSHDDGFSSANPLASTGPLTAGTLNQDFTDVGPSDHGAYFNFNFGTITAGSSYVFSVFYGGGLSETSVLGAIGAAGIELYSLGQSNGGQTTGSPYTFAFGFKGVGGTAVEPPPPTGMTPVPEPSTYALMGVATLGLIVAIRRRRAKAA